VAPLQYPDTLQEFECLSLSWLLPTPVTERRLREFGITDLYRAIWERRDVYLVAYRPQVKMFEIYVRQHYGIDLAFHTTFDRTTFLIFQADPSEHPRPEQKP